jgi:putative transcriptional regulator
VLHEPAGDWQATLKVTAGKGGAIGLTTSKDILEAVGRGEGPAKMLVSLGYAGWSAGQIEHELSQNAWLTVEAKDAILFDLPPDERLPAAMDLLGLDYARLADQAGHA